MSVDTLYTGADAKTAVKRVRIAGTLLPTVLSVDWQFAVGRVPTATIKVPHPPPAYIQFFADATIDVGFNDEYERVFTGKVLDVNRSETEATIMCTGMSQFLDRTSDDVTEITILNKTNIEVLEYLFGLAGIDYYTITLASWMMGTSGPLQLAFSSYAEAVTKVAEIDGARWAELPNGEIVVAVYDPASVASRTYFSMELTALVEAYPAGLSAADGRPRIRQADLSHRAGDVKNRIKVRGATVTETIGDLEVSDDIDWKLEAESVYVRNPDGSHAYADLLFSNDLIDTYEKAEEVALRLLAEWNRLPDHLAMTVEGDPLLSLDTPFLVEDPRYSGASGLFRLESYQCTLTSSDFSSQVLGEESVSYTTPPFGELYAQSISGTGRPLARLEATHWAVVQSTTSPTPTGSWQGLKRLGGHLYRIANAPNKYYPHGGDLQRSVDDGVTWETVIPKVTTPLPYGPAYFDRGSNGHMFAVSEQSKVVGQSTHLWRSLDDGATWTCIQPDFMGRGHRLQAYDVAVSLINPNVIGILTWYDNTPFPPLTPEYYWSEDGGETWQLRATITYGGGSHLLAVADGRFVMGGAVKVFTTDDVGASWQERLAITGGSVAYFLTRGLESHQLVFPSSKGTTPPVDFELFRSVDNGETWEVFCDQDTPSWPATDRPFGACFLVDGSLVVSCGTSEANQRFARCRLPLEAGEPTWDNWTYDWAGVGTSYPGLRAIASILRDGTD